MRRGLGGWIAIVLAWGLVSQAAAQVTVYHSPADDGVDPGLPLQLAVGPWESLYLYVDAGAAASGSGIACFDGDGRELCGFEATLDASGGATFVDFIPAPGIVHKLTTSRLQVNGLFSLSPALGPLRIGEVKVASSQSGGEVMVEAGSVILAALQNEVIPQAVVATTPTPEPSSWMMLGVGALFLGRLAARRARRS